MRKADRLTLGVLWLIYAQVADSQCVKNVAAVTAIVIFASSLFARE